MVCARRKRDKIVMYFLHLIYALSVSDVLCDTQRFDDGTFLVDFIVINKGQMQHPSIVMFIKDVTLVECSETCIKHLNCVTFNYNWKNRDCEIVDQKFDEFEAFDDDPHWYNYGTPDRIDGGWANWITSPHCSVTCGNGTTTQYRACTAPEPKYGGAPCVGDEVRSVSCNAGPCPIDGGLSKWKDDGTCSVTCGLGKLKQIRTCTNPLPLYGGKGCTGELKQTIQCNKGACPCRKTTFGSCCTSPCTYWPERNKNACRDPTGIRRYCY